MKTIFCVFYKIFGDDETKTCNCISVESALIMFDEVTKRDDVQQVILRAAETNTVDIHGFVQKAARTGDYFDWTLIKESVKVPPMERLISHAKTYHGGFIYRNDELERVIISQGRMLVKLWIDDSGNIQNTAYTMTRREEVL